MLVRLLIAIVLGVLTTTILEYLGIFDHGIDVLLGFAVALLVFFGYHL